MRLITARQAWHDSQYESRGSITAATMDHAKIETKRAAAKRKTIEAVFAAVGDEEESRVKVVAQRMEVQETRRSARDNSSSRCAHMMTMGRIQHAIASLNKPLQHFGHYLYSPLANARDQDVARTLVWFGWEKPAGLTKVKESRAYCLVLPALISYQGFVTGGRDEWTPGRIAEFVADWYGEKISVSQWARDWAPIWESLQRTIGEMDRKALEPVERIMDEEHWAA
ncbi:Phage antitermination protein Q [Stutzerimonas xanthomarina]|uniref:Phage antitermination protein Q n=3 Tax=Stutzerimonas xanthomarina TaxID=271420 RepID=A0A1M5MR23_9GAMM|nr:Phage antitermination protein Q [Stutzerimonas xanthomarina]SHG79761.1 Phage antitermination protein Q [Stutzerimonas xanthomarina DSM 18231]